MPNRLINETSPYLLQHAHNPVDWYAWGEEALERAKREDRPILLSIGYSACHWCHVMEHESFENPSIAQLMNSNFVNIKVDREERPDIDQIYMNAVQMMTGSGGWPLTVFLLPNGQPFFGGTYFPPDDAYGRPGFRRVLETMSQVYRSQRNDVVNNAQQVSQQLQQKAFKDAGENLDIAVLNAAADVLASAFDPRHGGSGRAPKFPPAMSIDFLLRYQHRTDDERALHMAVFTLDKMAYGGLYDQVGGGFHRYSTDERWLVPHFEKMLYDNALLARAYLDAYRVTGSALYKRITEETLDFVLREMRDASGALWLTLKPLAPGSLVATPSELSAQDAWGELVETAEAMLHDPSKARSAMDLDALRWNGEAMRAEGRTMAEHGRVMAEEAELMTAAHGLSRQRADDLRQAATVMRQVGGHLERNGLEMIDYADRLRRSMGFR
jgi:hypothetical protein